MPILRQTRRINPLDLNKNVKIGVAFPLDEDNMFSGTMTVKEQIKANLLNLLLTYPGERINEPNFGVGIKNLLFEQSIDLISLKIKIQDQINKYIAEIKLKEVITNINEDEHILLISLTYTYLLDNSSQSIQLNFTDHDYWNQYEDKI
jgi:phage baseplate assembly protein W